MKQMYDFPYPILKPDLTSSYRPDCNFEILDIADAEFENNNFIIKLQMVLQSATLKKYLLNNKCCIYIGYMTDTARRMIRVNNQYRYSIYYSINTF